MDEPLTARLSNSAGGFRRKASHKAGLSSPLTPPVLHGAAAPETQGRAWDPEEDAALLAAIERIGFHWKAVAKALESTGRTDAMCRNRYTRIKAPMKAGVECKNRCKRCGQMKRGHTCLTPEEQRAAERGAMSKDKDPQEAARLAKAAASHRAALKLQSMAEKQRAEVREMAMQVVVEKPCTWVQCDACEKWRRLWGVDEDELPDSWTCSDHPDAASGLLSCATPEEQMDEQEEMNADESINNSATPAESDDGHGSSSPRSLSSAVSSYTAATSSASSASASASSALFSAEDAAMMATSSSPPLALVTSSAVLAAKAERDRTKSEEEEERLLGAGWTRTSRPKGVSGRGNCAYFAHPSYGTHTKRRATAIEAAGETMSSASIARRASDDKDEEEEEQEEGQRESREAEEAAQDEGMEGVQAQQAQQAAGALMTTSSPHFVSAASAAGHASAATAAYTATAAHTATQPPVVTGEASSSAPAAAMLSSDAPPPVTAVAAPLPAAHSASLPPLPAGAVERRLAASMRRRENEEARFTRLGWSRIPRPDGKVVHGNAYAYAHPVHGILYDTKKIFRMHKGRVGKPDKDAVKRKLSALQGAMQAPLVPQQAPHQHPLSPTLAPQHTLQPAPQLAPLQPAPQPARSRGRATKRAWRSSRYLAARSRLSRPHHPAPPLAMRTADAAASEERQSAIRQRTGSYDLYGDEAEENLVAVLLHHLRAQKQRRPTRETGGRRREQPPGLQRALQRALRVLWWRDDVDCVQGCDGCGAPPTEAGACDEEAPALLSPDAAATALSRSATMEASEVLPQRHQPLVRPSPSRAARPRSPPRRRRRWSPRRRPPRLRPPLRLRRSARRARRDLAAVWARWPAASRSLVGRRGYAARRVRGGAAACAQAARHGPARHARRAAGPRSHRHPRPLAHYESEQGPHVPRRGTARRFRRQRRQDAPPSAAGKLAARLRGWRRFPPVTPVRVVRCAMCVYGVWARARGCALSTSPGLVAMVAGGRAPTIWSWVVCGVDKRPRIGAHRGCAGWVLLDLSSSACVQAGA